MSAHTPGKWEVVERSDTWNIKAGRRCIARLQKKTGAEADSRLIAAAPELLEALKAFIDIYCRKHLGESLYNFDALSDLCESASQAIEKATGAKEGGG